MHGDSGGLWNFTEEKEDPMILLGAPLHGGTIGELPWNLIQGPPGCHPGVGHLPHHIPHGGRRSDPSLGHAGIRRGFGNGRFRMGYPMAGWVLLL